MKTIKSLNKAVSILAIVSFMAAGNVYPSQDGLRAPLQFVRKTKSYNNSGINLLDILIDTHHKGDMDEVSLKKYLLESLKGQYFNSFCAVFFDRDTSEFKIRECKNEKDVKDLLKETTDVYDINPRIYKEKKKNEMKETSYSDTIPKIFVGGDNNDQAVDPLKFYKSLRYEYLTRDRGRFEDWFLPLMRLMLVKSPAAPIEILVEALNDKPNILINESKRMVMGSYHSDDIVLGYALKPEYSYGVSFISKEAQKNILSKARSKRYKSNLICLLLASINESRSAVQRNPAYDFFEEDRDFRYSEDDLRFVLLSKMGVTWKKDEEFRFILAEAEKKKEMREARKNRAKTVLPDRHCDHAL